MTDRLILTFAQFQAGRVTTTDLGATLRQSDLDGCPGFAYLGALYIELAPPTSVGAAQQPQGYLLEIEQDSWTDPDLAALELRLFDHACRARLCRMTQADIDAGLDRLTAEYEAWNKAQGLDLGSADEHLFDEALTAEQRAWLADFSERWNDVSPVHTKDGVFRRCDC